MKRLALVLVLAASAALPAAAPGAGCSPLDCSPTGSPLGHGLFAVRPDGVTGMVIVDNLRTGHTLWQLPQGILNGITLVHQDHADLTWFDALTGQRDGAAVVRTKPVPYLVGASQDGARAVLSFSTKHWSMFVIVSPHRQRTVRLRTYNWGFDALAGSNLYLLRYLRNGYQVRLYDLAANKLVATPLKDPHESALIWGSPWTRTSSPDGRYVFTLYIAQNGGAMVHELDVRRATARCIDLPGTGDFNKGSSYTLQLSRDGRTLWAVSPGYGRAVAIDVASARVRSAFRFRTERVQSPGTTVAALSPDGSRIAFGLVNDVRVLDTTRHRVVQAWHRVVTALAFSPDGRRLWVARGTVLRALSMS